MNDHELRKDVIAILSDEEINPLPTTTVVVAQIDPKIAAAISK